VPNYESAKKINKFNKLLTSVAVIVFILCLANLIGTNALATEGVVLDDLANKSLSLDRENRQLELAISNVSNLSYIEEVASQKGFVRTNRPLIIKIDNSLAAAYVANDQ